MNKLTPKQEAFAQKYVECSIASDAYRFAYNTENCTDKSIIELACQELGKVNVTSRVEEIRADLAKRNEVTLDTFNDELVYARNMADKESDYRELRANAMDRAKLHGIIIDKKELTGKDGKDFVSHITVEFEGVDDE